LFFDRCNRNSVKIKIRDDLEIGDGCEPFIIAEVGSNWRTLDDCLASIEAAKKAGADAVKFQAFDYESLYGMKYGEKVFWGLSKLADSILSLDWLPHLKNRADSIGIEFMCSAFSPELIEEVDPYVNIHKLASAEMCHVRMLEKLAKIDKPVFISTGGHTLEEIGRSLNIFGYSGGGRMGNPDVWFTPLVLMYCVSSYPAQEIYLENVSYYRQKFNTLVGYSDHSLDIRNIPTLAAALGSCVIEKHFKAIECDSPDSSHSLNIQQFSQMVSAIRGKENRELLTQSEQAMILRHNRRLIATKDIKVGEVFRENSNFGIYRSLRDSPSFFTPFRIHEVEGRKAKNEIQIGDALTQEDV